jgi:D-alanine-D-alanine ligase
VRLGNPHALLATLGKGELPPLDVALSIAEGYGSRNREAWAPALLEMAGVPCLGSDGLCLSASLDKAWAHRLVAAAGVPVPDPRAVGRPICAITRGLSAVREAALGGHREGDRPALARRRLPLARARGRAHRARLRSARARRALPARRRVHGRGGRARAAARAAGAPARARADHGIGLHAIERHPAPPGGWRAHTPGALDAGSSASSHGSRCSRSRRSSAATSRAPTSSSTRTAAHFLEINPLPTFAPDGSFAILAELAGRAPDDLIAEILGEALRAWVSR